MNIEDSFRMDAYDRAVRDGCSQEEAERKLLAEFRARVEAEEAQWTPEQHAERARHMQERAEGHVHMMKLFRERYGNFKP